MSAITANRTYKPVSRRVDLGRVLMMLLYGWTAYANLTWVANVLAAVDTPVPRKFVEVLTSALSLAFCLLVLRAYLRRGPASATDRNPVIWIAAPAGTLFPLGLGALTPQPGGMVRTSVSLALTVLGLAFSVWSLRVLSSSFSIVPQARGVVTWGPYRWVRHPLYLGELVGIAGMALHVGRPWLIAAFLIEVALQMYRAKREERLLLRQVGGYADYAARTRRIIPGLW
jgi:protein-S-isoprenylcysteine O-methyltransferase Ste14